MSSKKNGQVLTVPLNEKDVSFDIGRDDYNKYINSVTQNNKVAPSHNFLMSTVDETQKGVLREFLEQHPGSEVQLAGALLETYTPDLSFVVKKSSASVTA
jgi:hypothetical protein